MDGWVGRVMPRDSSGLYWLDCIVYALVNAAALSSWFSWCAFFFRANIEAGCIFSIAVNVLPVAVISQTNNTAMRLLG